jgi:hypothetical protein
MIAGEVPTPTFSLANRDVLLRQVAAIAFGAADPGLAGQMEVYVSSDGKVEQLAVDGLKGAIAAKTEHATKLSVAAFGPQLSAAGVTETDLKDHLSSLGGRIQNVVDRTARQVQELQQSIKIWAETLNQQHAAIRASKLIKRLLGIRDDNLSGKRDADDRSAGYPLWRFTEFGILPGYEFPTEPAALRLLGDEYEDDPITVDRRFGIGQFQPEAPVFARTKRWRCPASTLHRRGILAWRGRVGSTWSARIAVTAIACQTISPARAAATMIPARTCPRLSTAVSSLPETKRR